MVQTSSHELEELTHIFSEAAMPPDAGKRLFSILSTQGGMETFVRTFRHKLSFLDVLTDGEPSYRVYSSMGTDGYFIQKDQEAAWHDNQSGKEIPCITMLLAKHTGDVLRESYNNYPIPGVVE